MISRDLTGQKFNRLTAIKRAPRPSTTKQGTFWLCACECGNTTIVKTSKITGGTTKSCGCWNIEVIKERNKASGTHRMSDTREYNCWRSMKKNGGRGITYCARWEKFENFYKDMGDIPKGMSLDRIDNNGIYEPTNCKWSTQKEQSRNTVVAKLNKEGDYSSLSMWEIVEKLRYEEMTSKEAQELTECSQGTVYSAVYKVTWND